MRGCDDRGGSRQRENIGRRLDVDVGPLPGCGTPKIAKGVGYVYVYLSVGSSLKECFPSIIVSPRETLGQLSFYPYLLP